MAATPTGITQLIEKFEQNLESYRNPAYGETQVRVEFINPLFEALGWDVANNANISDPVDKGRQDKIVSLVERMLDLHKKSAAAKNPNDKTNLQREIEATDRQIDQLVYELYGLTAEEIRIVEEATRK